MLELYLASEATFLIHYKGMESFFVVPNIITTASVMKLTRDALSSKYLHLCKQPLISCTFTMAINITSVSKCFKEPV